MKHGKRMAKCALALGGLLLASAFAGCGKGNSKLLGAPADVVYGEEPEVSAAISQSAEVFARRFSESAKDFAAEGKNFAVSPVSAYMALSLAAECAAGETREEILSALGVSYETLLADFGDFYRSLNVEYRQGKLLLSNSVWINEREQVFDECVNSLAEKYFCYSYMADFTGDNEGANRAVREFVKERTKGLIDKDFNLKKETAFALINTLYLKDVWGEEPLPETAETYEFTAADGSVREEKFLRGEYRVGRAYEGEGFTSFYMRTQNGYRLQFMLPADGYTAEDIFTAENLAALSEADYGGVDEENKILYHTRCIFPGFSASFDEDIKNLLREEFGTELLFDEWNCDFTSFVPKLPDSNVYCSEVRHVTQLKVDDKGLEGAAVTVVAADRVTSAPMNDYEDVYIDFVADRSFGFVISDPNDVTLFSGIVRNI
ncbi:MAG TPA: hypothetical protein IAB32_06130 [Candidatus Scatosoma pullicola]|nr:hypothetical protein [Candidatus Scatosoma pullicola]